MASKQSSGTASGRLLSGLTTNVFALSADGKEQSAANHHPASGDSGPGCWWSG